MNRSVRLTAIVLFALMAAAFIYLQVQDNARRQGFSRATGALETIEAAIREARPRSGSVEVSPHAQLQPGSDFSRWRVQSEVELGGPDRPPHKETFAAVVSPVCKAYEQPRCWQMVALALNGRVSAGRAADLAFAGPVTPAAPIESIEAGTGNTSTPEGGALAKFPTDTPRSTETTAAGEIEDQVFGTANGNVEGATDGGAETGMTDRDSETDVPVPREPPEAPEPPASAANLPDPPSGMNAAPGVRPTEETSVRAAPVGENNRAGPPTKTAPDRHETAGTTPPDSENAGRDSREEVGHGGSLGPDDESAERDFASVIGDIEQGAMDRPLHTLPGRIRIPSGPAARPETSGAGRPASSGPTSLTRNPAASTPHRSTEALPDPSVNRIGADGATPLIRATRIGQSGRVRDLLARGAEPDLAGREGATPLVGAARSGHLRMTRMLLEAGADPDRVDGTGWTPLMAASAGGHVHVVAALLEAGADPDLEDENGRSALSFAQRGNHAAIAQLLRNHGAATKLR